MNFPGAFPHLFGSSANAQIEGRFRANVGFASEACCGGTGSGGWQDSILCGPPGLGMPSSTLPLAGGDLRVQSELSALGSLGSSLNALWNITYLVN